MPASERMARLRARQRADQRLLAALLADRTGRRLAHTLVAATPDLAQGVSDAVSDALHPVSDVSDAPFLHARGDVRSTAPVTTIEEAVLRTACAPAEADAALTDLERIELLLAPYAARRYVHRPAAWARLLAGCAGVDAVLEVIRACEWLDEPGHQARDCTFRFLSGWIKRAAQQPAALRPRSAPAPRRKPVGTEILEHLGYVAG